MARAKTTAAAATEEITVEPVAEPVAEPTDESPQAPAIDPVAYAKTASELAGAPIDTWAGVYAKVALVGLRYDGGVQWAALGAFDPASPDQAAIQRALDGNYQTLLYVSDAAEVLFQASRVDAKPFTVI